jgi:hypothetical protein
MQISAMNPTTPLPILIFSRKNRITDTTPLITRRTREEQKLIPTTAFPSLLFKYGAQCQVCQVSGGSMTIGVLVILPYILVPYGENGLVFCRKRPSYWLD